MKALVTAALVPLALVLASAPAYSDDPREDHRPCVSKREFNSLHIQTKAEVEARWEVVGLGRRTLTPLGTVVAYPRCGYSRDEAWYGVQYVPEGGRLIAYSPVSVSGLGRTG